MECDSTTDEPENSPETDGDRLGDISEMRGSRWNRPPSPQEPDSTTADPEEDDDIEVIYDSEFVPYPPPLNSAHPAVDIHGGFQDWNWHLPSSTTANEPEPAFSAGSHYSENEDEGHQMPTSTSADEEEPEVTIVYDSRLDESHSSDGAR